MNEVDGQTREKVARKELTQHHIGNPSIATFVLPTSIPGVLLSACELELKHYRGAKNALLKGWCINWAAQQWTIISIPLVDVEKFRKVLAGNCLTIAKGIPIVAQEMLEAGEKFPLPGGERVFSVWYSPDHPAYSCSTGQVGDDISDESVQKMIEVYNRLVALENEKIRKLFKRHGVESSEGGL